MFHLLLMLSLTYLFISLPVFFKSKLDMTAISQGLITACLLISCRSGQQWLHLHTCCLPSSLTLSAVHLKFCLPQQEENRRERERAGAIKGHKGKGKEKQRLLFIPSHWKCQGQHPALGEEDSNIST